MVARLKRRSSETPFGLRYNGMGIAPVYSDNESKEFELEPTRYGYYRKGIFT
jgi:hypothetical protein